MSTPLPHVIEFAGLRIRIANGAPILALSGAIIEATLKTHSRLELIHRLFTVSSVRRVRVSLRRGEVRLEFENDGETPRVRVAAVATALQGRRPQPIALPHAEVVLGRKAPRVFEIHRAASGLTFWRVESPSPRLFHIAHPLLRSEFIRKEVLAELGTLTDLVQRSVPLPLPGRESIVVLARPHRVEADLFAEVLDPVLTRCLAAGPAQRLTTRRELLVNGNLAIAPVADLLFPPAGIVNVGFTWLLSRGFVSHSVSALEQGRYTLELLYLVIAGLTVVTYQFLPSALMYWLMHFWPRRSQRLCEARHADFIARYRYRPRRVWVDRDGLSVEVRTEDLQPANVVTLTVGDVIPGDGKIVEGSAQVDERLLTGGAAVVTRGRGAAVYAATRIVDGSVKMKIDALGNRTASARLADWIDKALRAASSDEKVLKNAEQTVLPVLLAGAAGVFAGGLNTAKSVLRPDYFTGPAISSRMVGLATAMRAAHEGIVVHRHGALDQVATAGCVVFDDSVAWTSDFARGEILSDVAARQGLPELVFFSKAAPSEARQHGARLGFAHSFGNMTTSVKRDYIAKRRQLGRHVIYVGDCHAESDVARQADLAVSVVQPPYKAWSAAPVTLLAPDLSRFLQLHALALETVDEARSAFRLALVPNAVAVGGAFFLGSSVWTSVLLTNLGTFANYLRSGALLRLADLETRV
jgi:E1-E2 ATPase